jgi:hypothetical protein
MFLVYLAKKNKRGVKNMKKFGKVIKKIFALGVGALMVGTTVGAAMSATYNLGSFPEPMTKNGEFSGYLVVGTGTADGPASVEDVLGANDIMAALQAANVKTETHTIEGNAGSVTIDDGYKVGSAGDPLVLNNDLTAGRPFLTNDQLPNLLADGSIRVGNSDYDYTQKLTLGGREIRYSDVEDVPHVLLDLKTTGQDVWTYEVDIDDVNLAGLGTSVSIEMLGKTFTFDPNLQTSDAYLKMYASDVTTFLDLNEPRTIEYNGKSYELEVVGGSETNNNIILSVNGVRKTVGQSSTETINGLEVFVEDIFVTNIPTLSASANVFVGSKTVEVPVSNVPTLNRVKINGQTISGVEGYVETTAAPGAAATDGVAKVEAFKFQFKPYDLREDIEGFDRIERLLVGDSITDPLFGTFSIDFAKAAVSVDVVGDELQVTFEDYYGNEVTFTPYDKKTVAGPSVVYTAEYYHDVNADGFGFFGAGALIVERDIFALEETFGTQKGTKLYEVMRINDDNVELRNVATGQSKSYKSGELIGDSAVYMGTITSNANFVLSSTTPGQTNVASEDRVYLKGGKSYIDLGVSAGLTTVISVQEDLLSAIAGSYVPVKFDVTYTVGAGDTTIALGTVPAAGATNDVVKVTHKDRKEDWYLSELGTYAVYDSDNDDSFKAWVVTEEDKKVKYNVFVAPEGSQIIGGGSSGSTYTTETVVPIPVDASVTDVELMDMGLTGKNVVSVGGPAVNRVSAELMGKTFPAYGDESGVPKDAAMIKLFQANDNARIVVEKVANT